MIRIKITRLLSSVLIFCGAGWWQATLAQEHDAPASPDIFQGLRQFSEVNQYGSDTIDLQHLGLVVKQELSPSFRANDLPYQVVAYYQGSGWFKKRFPDPQPTVYTKYSWFTPSTLWGPLGAGWNVHMGKLLSSGLVEPPVYEGRIIQRGFTSDCTTVPFFDELGFAARIVRNDILDAGGRVHPDIKYFSTQFVTNDFSWIKTDSTSEAACHGVLGWRTPDGALYELNNERLVNRVTDLSGNRIEIEYYNFDAISQVRDCTMNPSWCNYETEMQDVEWTWERGDSPTHEVMQPIKSIRDSNGRRIDFILTDTAIGGKYRIAEIRSIAPSGQQSVYRLTYEERDVSTPADSAPPEFWGEIPPDEPCDSRTGFFSNCLPPQLDGSVRNQVIESAAFLVRVEAPDGLSTEYDYYPWGDLKSIRTIHGGVVKYTWKYWMEPTTHTEKFGGIDTNARRGIKLASRHVTPRSGDAQPESYMWSFEKNELPEKLDGATIYDQERTIVTLPSGNEMAYRFNRVGLVRNIKTYAGKAFRWVEGRTDALEGNITSPPNGRLLREIERWTEAGGLGPFPPELLRKNPGEPGFLCYPSCYSASARVVREETYYLDDPIQAPPVTDLAQDWRYDILGTTFAIDAAGTQAGARKVFSHTAWALEGWQRERGYTREIIEGSALGFRRVRERKFTDFENLTADEGRAQNVNFRWPVAWVRETQISGPAGAQQVSQSLTEFQYDTTQLHKVVKMVRRKNPGVTPNDHPYVAPASALPGDVVVTYELLPARSLLAALPTTPTPTAYGLISRVIRQGGDPVTTLEGAPGDSGVVYDETISYEYGVPKTRQYAEIDWKSVNTGVDPSGHVTTATDSALVATSLQYDAAGDLTRITPSAVNGTEYPLHIDKDLPVMGPRDDEHRFPGGRKLFARTAWRGPTGADYVTDLTASYVRAELDGLGRTVRLERKLEDGSKVSKKFEYGAGGGQNGGRWGLDRVTREEAWAPVGSTGVPATTQTMVLERTGDALLDNRPDPFERYWKITLPDSAVRLLKHFGTNHAETAQGIKGVDAQGADKDLMATTTYYKDSFGRPRLVDGPAGGADAIYEYDLFGNISRAVTLSTPAQLAPTIDASGFCTDRFTVAIPGGQERLFTADALGRIRSVTNPENGTLHLHAYDPEGNLLLSDDENNVIQRRAYDRAGRLSRVEWCKPISPSVECEPSTPGQLLTELIYHNSNATPARDRSLGKLLTLKGFDDTGALLSQQEFYYQGLNGRLSEERSTFKDWTPGSTIETGTSPYYAVKYSYAADGRIGEVTYPHSVGSSSGATLASHTYTHGWQTAVVSNRTVSAGLKYHPSGLPREIYHFTGKRTLIGADQRGRVASIDVVTTSGVTLWKTGTHRYDGAGNLYEIGESAPSFPADDLWRFRYDELQRLARAKVAGYEISYAYDLYGNMTAQNFLQAPSPPPPGMAFANRQYTDNQVQDPSYSYDPNGDLRDAEGQAFDYDVRSRLTSPGTVDGIGQLVSRADYRYSGLGLRSSKDDKTAGWTTFYFRDLAGEVLSEYSRPNAGGTPGWNRDYFYAAGRHIGVVENGPPSTPGNFVTCAQAGSRTCSQSAGTQAITLDWASNLDADVYGYRVYRGTSAEQFNPTSGQSPPVRVHPGEVTSSYHADTTSKSCSVSSGQYCWYAVTAVDSSGKEGGYSAPLAVQLDDTTPPGVPRQLRVSGTSGTTVYLAWSPPSGTLPVDFLGYYVFRSLTPGATNPALLNLVPTSATTFNDVGLLCETNYYYRVVSTDTAQNLSPYSTEIIATTGACSSGGGGEGNKKRTQLGPQGFPPEDTDPSLIVGVAEAMEPDIAATWPTEIAQRLEVDGFTASSHQTVGQVAGDWIPYALHTDHLGSIRLVTNVGEQVVARHRYFPFGQEIGPIPQSPSTHRYIGREWDPESGMLYLMARYSHAATGARFLTVDPIMGPPTRPDSLNRYAYGFDSPLRYYDPQGLFNIIAGGQASAVAPWGGAQLSAGIAINPGFGNSEAGIGAFATPAGLATGVNLSAEIFGGFIFGDLANVGGSFTNVDISGGPIALTFFFSGEGFQGMTVGWGTPIPSASVSKSSTGLVVLAGGSGSKPGTSSTTGGAGSGAGTAGAGGGAASPGTVVTTWICISNCPESVTGKK